MNDYKKRKISCRIEEKQYYFYTFFIIKLIYISFLQKYAMNYVFFTLCFQIMLNEKYFY